MSCKTPIFRAVYDSPTLQAVDADGTIVFADATSNTGCISQNNGTISIRQAGNYKFSFNVTFQPTAAGPVEVQLYRNGSPVPGAHAIDVAAAAADNVSLAASAVASVECCNTDTFSLRVVQAGNVRIANIIIEGVE